MDSESQPSVNVTVPVPRLLNYSDISTAVDGSIDAFKGDPVHGYLYETPDARDTVLTRASRRTDFSSLYAILVHKGTIWTIDDGASVVGYTPVDESQPGWSVDKLVEAALPYVLSYRTLVRSTEQNKRAKEVKAKLMKAGDDTLGARKGAMIYLDIAVTSPAKQGRGYASTLIRIVTAKADEEKRAVWLWSSNPANEAFYNSHGFKTRAEILLGDDNPAWTAPPVPFALMIREFADDSDVLR